MMPLLQKKNFQKTMKDDKYPYKNNRTLAFLIFTTLFRIYLKAFFCNFKLLLIQHFTTLKLEVKHD